MQHTNHSGHGGAHPTTPTNPRPLAWIFVTLVGLILLTTVAIHFGWLTIGSANTPSATMEHTKLTVHKNIHLNCDEMIGALKSSDPGYEDDVRKIMNQCEDRHRKVDGYPLQPVPTFGTPQNPTPQPAPAVQTTPVKVGGEREPLREFVRLDDLRYQLDARDLWREVGPTAQAGKLIRITASANFKVCSAEKNDCAGPDGLPNGIIGNQPEYVRFASHNGTAQAYALLGKWGEDGEVFLIGSKFESLIPQQYDGKKLFVMANVETPENYRQANTGGHRILSITIE